MVTETENESKTQKVTFEKNESDSCAINIGLENRKSASGFSSSDEMENLINSENIDSKMKEIPSSYRHRFINLQNFNNTLLNRSLSKELQSALNVAALAYLLCNEILEPESELDDFVLEHSENHPHQLQIQKEWKEMKQFFCVFKKLMICEVHSSLDCPHCDRNVSDRKLHFESNFLLDNEWKKFLKSLISDSFNEEFAVKVMEESKCFYDRTERKKLPWNLNDFSKIFLLIILDAYSHTVPISDEKQMKIFLLKIEEPHTYDHHVFYTICANTEDVPSIVKDQEILQDLKDKLLKKKIIENEYTQITLNPNLLATIFTGIFAFLSLTDFAFDIYTAVDYFESNEMYYGGTTVFIITVAGLANIFLERYISRNPFFNQKYLLKACDMFPIKDILSFFQVTPCIRSFRSCFAVFQGLKKSQKDLVLHKIVKGEKSSLHFSSTTVKYVENCIESVPQAALQLHFILNRNEIGCPRMKKLLLSVVCIIGSALSFLSLWNYQKFWKCFKKYLLSVVCYFGFTLMSYAFLFYICPWQFGVFIILLNITISIGSRPADFFKEQDTSLKFFNIKIDWINYFYFSNGVTVLENVVFLIVLYVIVLETVCHFSVPLIFFLLYLVMFGIWSFVIISENYIFNCNIMNLCWFIRDFWNEK